MAADANSGKKKGWLSLEEGWPILEESVNNVIDIIEGVRLHQITQEEYMRAFTAVHDMCHFESNAPRQYEKLYDRYQKIFEDYVSSKVLPHLRGKNGKFLLKELVRQWNNYKILRKWLVKFFCHLDGCYIGERHSRSLPKTSNLVFYELVYGEINDQVRDAVLSEINLDRKGKEIDEAVVKNAVEIYVEMAEGSMKYYEKDFETALVKDAAQFYSQEAADWLTMAILREKIRVISCLRPESFDKIFKVIICEKIRVICCLRPESFDKVFKVVKDEVLTVVEETNGEDD